ncbi:hypothetical protein BG46_03395 [Brucella anthropi]|nr:hypothetical protein BG46_03395 [Brucella anthropi]
MRCAIDSLTFELVDDIALAAPGYSGWAARMPRQLGEELGPMLELWRLGHLPAALSQWLVAPDYAKQLSKVTTMTDWFSSDGSQGVIAVRSIMGDATNWQNFSIKAKNAAITIGVPQPEAWQLIASLEEIYTNTIEHSERADSGLVAYVARPNSFEYVVCDAGIGVQRSLRKNPHYAAIPDSCTALELALREGISAKAEQGRGMGFRPILVGLTNLSRMVRFRSGDGACIFSRQADGTLPATTLQRAWIDGFFCSVRIDACAHGGR